METRVYKEYCISNSADTLSRAIASGYKFSHTYAGTDVYIKVNETPRYSSQCKCKYIGTDGVDSLSGTRYYSVSKEDFDAMEIKPELTNQCKPYGAYDFDGIVETTSNGHEGLGWKERWGDNLHDNNSAVYFVEQYNKLEPRNV